jgi:hypothetical protein
MGVILRKMTISLPKAQMPISRTTEEPWFVSRQRQKMFLFAMTSVPARSPPSPLCTGHGGIFSKNVPYLNTRTLKTYEMRVGKYSTLHAGVYPKLHRRMFRIGGLDLNEVCIFCLLHSLTFLRTESREVRRDTIGTHHEFCIILSVCGLSGENT